MKGIEDKIKEEAVPSSFDNTLSSKKDNFMIILYSKKINNFNEFFLKYNNFVNLPYLECPNCNSTNIIKWGSYNRNINYLNEFIVEYKIINIQRVKCKNCGKTHALIPYFIVPYRINTLDIILKSLLNDTDIDISFDTIYKWNKDFNKFYPYLKTMFFNISKLEIIKKLNDNILTYFIHYFKLNKKIFMMMKSGFYNIAFF